MIAVEEVGDFFQSYLDAEFAASSAVSTEPDEILEQRRAILESFMYSVPGKVMSSGIGRGRGWSAEQLADLAQRMKVARRPLFLVVEYVHPKWKQLFAGYIGGGKPRTAGAYGELLFAAEIEGKMRVIATYREDFDRVPPPVHWKHAQGAEIGKLARPVGVLPVEAPTSRAAHFQDWQDFRRLPAQLRN
ncbi:hypothetical protein GCM10009716_48780 [Streptomyces sodiiphilus]|uniref:Uncharacterized protein n=1 Tax=Streptomyces sodiiphilus TaxID=226217 RepID=A0ABN2PWT1_9ACTN